ncbi:uncharacterized protein LOC135138675 [Zophobas morio]|uniref:uncharacterized protein LOC135138675 n=1 Tax=Zophobas morio TaxID=2755281 RepID=UPI0030839214
MIERLSELMNDVWTCKGFSGEWLVTEMNEKCILPESQAGFRRGRGAMDNVYILNHLIEKELLKEGGRVYALFVDLRAAFDTVDRECLWECMERRGLSEKLIAAAGKIYRETVTSVRVGGVESEMFRTTKGLRQGCPLSPSLFACYISLLHKRNDSVILRRMNVE